MGLWPTDPELEPRQAGDPDFYTDLPPDADGALVFQWARTSVLDPEPGSPMPTLAGLALELGAAGALIAHGDTGKLMDLAMATDAAVPEAGAVMSLAFCGVGPGLACTVELRAVDAKDQPLPTRRYIVEKWPEERGILDSLLRLMNTQPLAQKFLCQRCGRVHRQAH